MELFGAGYALSAVHVARLAPHGASSSLDEHGSPCRRFGPRARCGEAFSWGRTVVNLSASARTGRRSRAARMAEGRLIGLAPAYHLLRIPCCQ